MLNVYEQIDRNKQRSTIVIIGFVLFVVGFVWLMGNLLGSDPGLIFAAALFSLFSAFSSYFWGDKIVLALHRAKPANKKDHFDFYTVVENLSIAAQIPKPQLYVIKSEAANAFATGRDPKHAVVCATTGLLEKLDRSELEGVIAHEISHVKNFDIRLMMVVAILVGMVSLVSNWMFRGMGQRRRNEERKGHPSIQILGIIVLILSPLIGKLIQLAISRQREYLADASAAKLTRYPQGLISALKKIAASPAPLLSASPATAHLFIVNPLKKMKIASLFSTHPPLEERIKTLEKML